ncbi:MAG: sensor domain-containing diguanylate cyclase [Alphaproteobacteria bacterium]|jgi:diguanylate cyclase (GGDEF)-like protein/PAS domain S-box-containing protein|nr:sensor domain-containing diguanylate cyclase [Alphaproteobacteria bacterium]
MMKDLICKEYCKAFFESSFDAIFLTKPNGEIIRANPAACEMFGRTEEEFRKLGRNGIIDNEDPRLEQGLSEREKNGKIRIELNFLRRDGTRFPVDLSSTIIRTKDEETLSLIIIRDISIWKEAEEALKREKELLENISVFDYLTKILNRRGLMKRIEEEIVRCNRSGTALTLAMVDMDFLKKINDAYGHRCGDEVLCRVVEVFKENIRPYDILGRFAGDEFIFCFPATGLAEGIIIAERLRKSLENAEIEYEGSKITVTASFGLTEYQPDSNMNVDNLFSKADDQMYLAKRRRNFVCFPQN